MSSGPDSPRSFTMSSSTPARNAFALLPPEEFLPYVVPFTGGPGVLAGKVEGVRSMAGSAGLSF